MKGLSPQREEWIVMVTTSSPAENTASQPIRERKAVKVILVDGADLVGAAQSIDMV